MHKLTPSGSRDRISIILPDVRIRDCEVSSARLWPQIRDALPLILRDQVVQIKRQILLTRIQHGGVCTGLCRLTGGIAFGEVVEDWWEACRAADVAGVIGVFGNTGACEDLVV